MWEILMETALQSWHTTQQVDRATSAGLAGAIMAMTGGLGWLTTENVLWLIPIGIAVLTAAANGWYGVKFARAKARIDLEVYKARLKRDTHLELKALDPTTPDPDSL